MIWRLGVVGFPIEHSLSPRLHEVGLSLCGLEGTSERLALREHQAPALREAMGARFDAVSVTMPLKGVAAGLCDSLDDAARRTGSVNSLLVRDGILCGASTDGQGLVNAVRAQFDEALEGWTAVVLGAGGAARSIVDALVHNGVASVAILARTSQRAEEIAAGYANVTTMAPTTHVQLIVNTTPAPTRDNEVSVLASTTSTTIAVDIAYEPRMSPWRTLYEQAGCRTSNGLGMLAYQAALQMEWWWAMSIDGSVLYEAIRD